MPITKSKKKEIFDKVDAIIKDSQSLVFTNVHGLTVSESTQMRKKLRASGVGFLVAKKTITKKALEKAGITGEMPTMLGELGVAFSKDQIAPAREVYDFEKKFDKKLSIQGGVFEGRFMSKSEMTVIASIPPLIVLRGQFLNVINSPIQGLVIALDAIAKKKTA